MPHDMLAGPVSLTAHSEAPPWRDGRACRLRCGRRGTLLRAAAMRSGSLRCCKNSHMSDDELRDLLQQLIRALDSPTAADIAAALAAWLTFAVAAVALVYAAVQVGEAKRSRQQARQIEIERAQPYVVAYMEPSPATNLAIDLVIKNYGQTAARDVRLSVDPSPRRSQDNEVVTVPFPIPILAPGQEWRTSWDYTPSRMESALPKRHVGRVRYTGIDAKTQESVVVLDWSIYTSRHWIEVHGVHAGVVALRELRDNLAKWTEKPNGPLSVLVRDGEAKDDALRAQKAKWLAGTRAGSQTLATDASIDGNAESLEPIDNERASFLTQMIERGHVWLKRFERNAPPEQSSNRH